MAKYTIQMNDKLEQLLEELAEKEGVSKAQVIRRSLTLLKLAEEQEEEGYELTFTKEGQPERRVLIT
jgi:predicted transcriptional regulator